MGIPNIFDLYGQIENRLTNGLVQILYHSKHQQIFKSFFDRFLKEVKILETDKLEISEQEKEEKSIPDANIKIYSKDKGLKGYIIVESKLKDRIDESQLKNHRESLDRIPAGFKKILYLTTDKIKEFLTEEYIANITWSEIFEWVTKMMESKNKYNEVEKFLINEYWRFLNMREEIKDFQGFNFGEERKYDRDIAIEMLKKFRAGLLQNEKLKEAFRIEEFGCKDNITGEKPWTVIFDKKYDKFNNGLHFTFIISKEAFSFQLTIPNKAKKKYIEKITSNFEKFKELIGDISKNLKNESMLIRIYQRHWVNQKLLDDGKDDGKLFFRVGTFIDNKDKKGKEVRHLNSWIESFERVLKNPKITSVNIEIAFRNRYFFDKNINEDISEKIKTKEFLDIIVNDLICFKELYFYLEGKNG